MNDRKENGGPSGSDGAAEDAADAVAKALRALSPEDRKRALRQSQKSSTNVGWGPRTHCRPLDTVKVKFDDGTVLPMTVARVGARSIRLSTMKPASVDAAKKVAAARYRAGDLRAPKDALFAPTPKARDDF